MNNLLVNKDAIRLKYIKEFGKEPPLFDYELSEGKAEYLNWLETIVSECIRRNLVPTL